MVVVWRTETFLDLMWWGLEQVMPREVVDSARIMVCFHTLPPHVCTASPRPEDGLFSLNLATEMHKTCVCCPKLPTTALTSSLLYNGQLYSVINSLLHSTKSRLLMRPVRDNKPFCGFYLYFSIYLNLEFVKERLKFIQLQKIENDIICLIYSF